VELYGQPVTIVYSEDGNPVVMRQNGSTSENTKSRAFMEAGEYAFDNEIDIYEMNGPQHRGAVFKKFNFDDKSKVLTIAIIFHGGIHPLLPEASDDEPLYTGITCIRIMYSKQNDKPIRIEYNAVGGGRENPKFMDFTKAGTYILEEAIDIFEIFGPPPYIPGDTSFILSDYVGGDTYLWLIYI
jgi:hypothetical protein